MRSSSGKSRLGWTGRAQTPRGLTDGASPVTRSALRRDRRHSVALPLPAPPWGHVLPARPGQGPRSEQDCPVGLTPGLALPDGQDSPSKQTPSIHALSGWGCGLSPGVCGVRARLRSVGSGPGYDALGYVGVGLGPGVCWGQAVPWGQVAPGLCQSQAGPWGLGLGVGCVLGPGVCWGRAVPWGQIAPGLCRSQAVPWALGSGVGCGLGPGVCGARLALGSGLGDRLWADPWGLWGWGQALYWPWVC